MASTDGTTAEKRNAAKQLCAAADLLTTRNSDYVQAYQYLLSAQSISDAAGEDSLAAEAQFRIGGISYIFQDYDKSRELVRSCFDIASRHGWDDLMLKSISNMMASTMVSDREYEAAAPYLARFDTMQLTRTPHERFVRSFREVAKAGYKGDLDGMLRAIDSCERHITPDWDDGQSAYVLATLKSLAYRNKGDYSHALACIRGVGQDDAEKRFRVYSNLMRIYRAMGNEDSARFWADRKYAVRDTAFNVQRYGSLRSLELRGEMERAARDYRVLQVRSDMHLLLFWIALAAALVIGVLGWRLLVAHRRLLVRNRETYRLYLEHKEGERRLMEHAAPSPPSKAKYGEGALSEQEMLDIVAACRRALQDSDAPYNPDFRIEDLAELIDVPKRYVSQSINGALGQNFGSFIGAVRVNRACELLTGEEGRNLSIEGVATMVGFRSRSHFVNVFKRVTGLTPTEYVRAAKH